MELLFRALTLAAFILAGFSLFSANLASTRESVTVTSADSSMVAALKIQVDHLQAQNERLSAEIEGLRQTSPAEQVAAPTTQPDLKHLIDQRIDERMKNDTPPTAPTPYSKSPAEIRALFTGGQPMTLDDVANQIGLTDLEIDFIRETKQQAQDQATLFLLEDGESLEDFQALKKQAQTDSKARIKLSQRMMKSFLQGDGLAKIMTLEEESNSKIRDYLGDSKFNDYVKLAPRITEPGFNGGFGVGMRMGR